MQKTFRQSKPTALYFGKRFLYCENAAEILFTENETNIQTLYNAPNASVYAKDGINEFIVNEKSISD